MADAENPVPLDDQLCFAVYSAGMAIQRLYKPLLDGLGLTYPQYLVLNALWAEDGQTVGSLARRLTLESSTLTPLLKRLEEARLVSRTRNPRNERQVVIALTARGHEIRPDTGCLNNALLDASDESPQALATLNRDVKRLRDAIYGHLGSWDSGAEPKGNGQQP
ncbi:MarR family winged helix-turn-helix transcriptional regulator [Devosia sp. CN2-171]|jgi:MarR family transcriptional regulator, organic hydroperoxide resistance regulator|uniref:MarR family winged helix-turn-helix transcriptional regulator n=1 Tax=Devosia sp. CN2-171 TaxID=3400909 RepID=UPI003BF8A7E5